MNYLKGPLALFLLLGHKTAAMADRYIRRAITPVVDATEAVSGGFGSYEARRSRFVRYPVTVTAIEAGHPICPAAPRCRSSRCRAGRRPPRGLPWRWC